MKKEQSKEKNKVIGWCVLSVLLLRRFVSSFHFFFY